MLTTVPSTVVTDLLPCALGSIFQVARGGKKPKVSFLPGSVSTSDSNQQTTIQNAANHYSNNVDPRVSSFQVSDDLHMNAKNDPHVHATTYAHDHRGQKVHQQTDHMEFSRTHLHLAPHQSWTDKHGNTWHGQKRSLVSIGRRSSVGRGC